MSQKVIPMIQSSITSDKTISSNYLVDKIAQGSQGLANIVSASNGSSVKIKETDNIIATNNQMQTFINSATINEKTSITQTAQVKVSQA